MREIQPRMFPVMLGTRFPTYVKPSLIEVIFPDSQVYRWLEERMYSNDVVAGSLYWLICESNFEEKIKSNSESWRDSVSRSKAVIV